MKKKLSIISIFLLFALNSSWLHAQQMTTMGTDFWVAPIIPDATADTDGISDRLELNIVCPRSCSATITNPHTNYDTTINVVPGQVANISIDISNYISFSSNTLVHNGFHITSTDSISVYAYQLTVWADATNILPTHALGNDYIIQTYPAPDSSLIPFHLIYTSPNCSFTIIATEDSTYVTIILQGETRAGNHPGDTITAFIQQAGLCYQVISTIGSDLSGTRITSLNGKRIAVFEGNDSPLQLNFVSQSVNCFGRLYEQAIPTVFWGRHFFPHNSARVQNRVRITSLNNDCSIWINNQYISTINEYETYEYTMPSNRKIDYINTSQPACVGVYTSSLYDYPCYYLPEMLIVPPWEQASEGVVFGIERPLTHFNLPQQIHIITKTNETHFLKLDSNSISNHFHPIDVNPAFSYARFIVNAGSHTLYTTDGDGFVAWIYDTIFTWYSSMYSVGAALRDAQNSLTIGNTTHACWIDTVEACINDEINMQVESIFTFDSVRWTLGDGYSTNADQITHSFTHTGLYSVQAIVYASCDGCYKQIDTLASTIAVFAPDTTYADTIICGDSFFWQDSTYYEGDQITTLYHNRHGCDSLKFSTLRFRSPTYSVIDTLYACDSLLFYGVWYKQNGLVSHDTLTNADGCDSALCYYVVINTQRSYTIADTLYGCDSLLCNNIWYFQDTTAAFDTLTAANRCDSILLHAIAINRSYERTQEIIIRDTATLTWIDGNTYSESTDSPYVVLQATNGCDSTIHLHLTVLPTPPPALIDSTAVWVPNTFTPGEDINNCFRILCNDIITAEVSIFNRLGLHICTFDGLADSWDGTYKGAPCPQGAYVYLITYTTVSQPSHPQRVKGTVLLLR